ncbi:F-box and FNIP repeat-containing protein, partial [Bandra megavirus]
MSITDILNTDVILCILEYLKDDEKMNFMMTCREYYQLKNYINYTSLYEYNNVKNLPMNNRFKRLIYRGQISNKNEDIIEYIVEDLDEIIPTSVTHLTFGDDFNQDITDCIPDNITHLTFGYNFNKNIKGCVPNSVIYLKFGSKFNQNIKGCVPNSVTHLTFGSEFNRDVK